MYKLPNNKGFLAVMGVFVLGGCQSAITGNEGNLQFSYATDDSVLDFNKPIAVGAKLDLSVSQAGAGGAVTVTAASFDQPEVLDVNGFSAFVVVVKAKGEGNALLSVEGNTGTEQLTDSVNLLARVPEVLTLRHTCTDQADANYMTDQKIFLPFEMEMENGQPVIGYGYYPVSVSPQNAVSFDDSNSRSHFLATQTASVAGPVTLSSDIDNTSLIFELVEPGQIDGVTDPIALGNAQIAVGDKRTFHVLPSSGGVPICQANVPMSLTTNNPTVCLVAGIDPIGTGDDEFEFGWFTIDGIGTGTCEFSVTYPDGDDGNGITASFVYNVVAP